MMMKVYVNKRNPHKYVEVVRYKCGHYYLAQSIRHSRPGGGEVVNYTGSRMGRRCRKRWTVNNVRMLLDDYDEVIEMNDWDGYDVDVMEIWRMGIDGEIEIAPEGPMTEDEWERRTHDLNV